MIKLSQALAQWPSEEFRRVLKEDIDALDGSLLPLQQGLQYSSYVSDSRFSTMIISIADESASIVATMGVFYSGVIAGCNCADDPTSIDEINEYCEIVVTINKLTAEATIECLLKKNAARRQSQ